MRYAPCREFFSNLLDRHFPSGPVTDRGTIHLAIPADEIKNDVDFRVALTKRTSALLRLYVTKYRGVHAAKPCTWLFPKPDGSHWTQHSAYVDLKDTCDKLLGLDVTPHLMRAIGGKIILDAYPGGHAIVQQCLGHRSLQTTIGHYAPMRASTARHHYHKILDRNLTGNWKEIL